MRKLVFILCLLISSQLFGQIQFRFGSGRIGTVIARQNLVTLPGPPTTLIADAESGSNPYPYYVYAGADPGGVLSIQRSSTWARHGTKSFKTIVNKTDAEQQAGVRAEFSNFSDGLTGYNYERWEGFSMLIPSAEWGTNETNPVLYYIVQQWHDNTFGVTPAETEYKSSFEFVINCRKFSFVRRACDNESGTSFEEDLADTSGARMNLSNPTIVQDTWYDIVIHLVWNDPVATNPNRNESKIEIWINGVKCANWDKSIGTGRMGFHHTLSPFYKQGNYCWMWNSGNLACCGNLTNATRRVHYWDDLRLGTSLATFYDVDPSRP